MYKYFVMLFCLASICDMSYAARYDISGSLHGEWLSGDTVCLVGPSFVPRDKSLIVHGGAVVMPKTTDAFVIRGHFEAVGTFDRPVYLVPCEDWAGFHFIQDSAQFQTFNYMVMDDQSETSEIAAHIIVATDSWIRLTDCIFIAKRSCVTITHGRLQATNNRFKTTEVYSKTVAIDFLTNGIQDPCHNPEGNVLRGNIIKADIPLGVQAPPNPGFTQFTSALMIDGSTDLCIFGNAISVASVGYTIGAFFGETVEFGTVSSTLDSCVIAVQGRSAAACGVMNSNEGDLRIVTCTINTSVVTDNYHDRIGIFASQSASCDISNCIVELDMGTNYFVGESGGLLTIRYTDKWTNPDAGNFSAPHEESRAFRHSLDEVILGDGIINVDPMFRREGVWGEWRTLQEVSAYYSLQPTSGCIDNGDPTLGLDPDGSPRDLGCFYYDQMTNDVPERQHAPISSVALAPAYPNPFNATTVIPFQLDRGGRVTLKLYDVLGREVGSLLAGNQSAGFHEIPFSADGLPSGIYLVTLSLNDEFIGKQKLVLLK